MNGRPHVDTRQTSIMNRATRVCFFLARLADGGAERATLNLVPALRKLGFDAYILVGRSGGPLECAMPDDCPLISLNAGRARTTIRPLIRFLRDDKPDVLISVLNYTNAIAFLSHMLARSPAKLIFAHHGVLSQEVQNARRLSDKLLPAFYRLFGRRADAVIAVSEGAADDLAKASGLPRRAITAIHNPAISDDFETRTEEPVAHPFFELSNVPVFLSAGRLVEGKDFATVIRAFARLTASTDARLLIAGDGSLRGALENLCAELGVASRVSFLGFVGNLLAYLRRATCVVSASRYESFGIVLVEALAAGIPVVSTDCPTGPAEILVGGKYGTLVPVGNAEALAEAMADCLRNPPAAALLKSRAADFATSAIAKRYAALIDDVMAGTKAHVAAGALPASH